MNEDFMREEILFQKEILMRFYDESQIEPIPLKEYDELWLTGSGDSHCASLFGSALVNTLGLTGRALTPMNASYYMNHTRNVYLLLFAISVSGKTPRVVEVVKKVTKQYSRHKIIGLTDNPHSELAKISDQSVILKASPSEVLESSDYKDGIAKLYTGYHHDVAQTKTYFANILYLIAFLYPEFYSRKSFTEKIFSEWLELAEHIVKQNPINYPTKTIFIGSGLQESLAQFGQYKWFEYTFPGLHQDVEEYAHTHYFTTDEETTLIFFAPKGPILERTLELINGALGNLIKPQIIVITNKKVEIEYDCTIINTSQGLSEQNHLSLAAEVDYYIRALIVLEWYTYHTARTHGFDTNKFRGGAEGEKYVRGSYYTIRKSKITD